MSSEVPEAPPPFDLEAYIARYPAGSESKLQRLLFIAERSPDPHETILAYQLAEQHMRQSSNVRRYKEVFGAGSKGGVVYDAAWVGETELANQAAMDTLEARLSAAQAHLQKEAIRTAYLAIGEFCHDHGELQQALRAVMRSRDYCTNRSQTSHVCLLVIELAMDTNNFQQMHDYVAKAEHSTIPGDVAFPMKLKVASGIAYLFEGKLKDAATQLISVPVGSDGSSLLVGALASAEDVALYAALCGIATLERQQLKRLLETQASGFLDLVPPLRDALQLYCRADYPGCLRVLNALYPRLRLDMVLSPHLDKIFETILHKCCVEYLKPYRKVDLSRMANIFSLAEDRLVSILAGLIGSRQIEYARIDCLTKTLERLSDEEIVHRRQEETRKRIRAMEQTVLNDAYSMMIRVACLENETGDRRKQSYMDYMESDDDDARDEPMEITAGNPEDVY